MEGGIGGYGFGVDVEVEGFEGELKEGFVGAVGRKDFEFSGCAYGGGYLDRNGGGGVIFQEGRVDEVVFLGLAVPEEGGGFFAVGAFQGFGLEGGGFFAVEFVLDGYGGGFVDRHQFS